MNPLAQELDDRLRTLDSARAQRLASLVREALDRTGQDDGDEPPTGWPIGYFESTAAALAGEELERPAQGDLPRRDNW